MSDYEPITYNRISQVYFRAGLLACREYMARFVEQGGDHVTAASIRANWWPSLGDDPGPPRKLDFNEITDGGERGPWHHKPISPSLEALPYALGFLEPAVCDSPLHGGPEADGGGWTQVPLRDERPSP